MKAAVAAPSSCNEQPWRYVVVNEKQRVIQLADAITDVRNGFCKDASAFIVVLERKRELDREALLMREQLEINEARNNSKVGKIITVLCEDFDPVSEVHFGRSAEDAPEIDGKVYFRAAHRIAPGSFVKVKIREVLDYDLMGRAMLEDN